jgi:putative NADH-flavin reductase
VKIAIIGASGWVGGAIAAEALLRGHEVTAVSRDPSRLKDLQGASVATADLRQAVSIKRAVAGHDAVVTAVVDRSAGNTEMIPQAARTLLRVLPEAHVKRLVFAGGGGSLEVAPGTRFVDAPEFPAQYRSEALAQAEALQTLRSSGSTVDWTYVSPPPVDFFSGEKTGSYRVQGGDSVLNDASGQSRVSVADFASAIIDELESPRFIGQRFTVAY